MENTTQTVIGPISLPHWYCMRQCRESIKYCESKRDPHYDVEIAGEKALYNTFMQQIFEGKAA